MSTEKNFSIRLVLFSLFMLISATMMAQVTVSGSVIDMQGEPIPGASIRESGTRNAAVTDADGRYAINVVDANAILNVSFIGYQSQTVRIAGRRLVTITLEDDETALKDIVIVGYGTMKKSDLTGAVSVIDTKEMMKRVPTNIAQALQGAAAGVYVSQQDGAPDANAQIRIRGYGTINGISQPLYVVDGVKVGTNANFLLPTDIETVEVLKDASATAIYGSEGANGVVMITTKHGQAGRTQVQFNADFGVGTLPYKLDVISVDELAKCIRNARINDNATWANKVWNEEYDGKRNNIDWQDQMTQAAIKQQYSVSVLGGNEKTQYNFSVGYLDNKGLIVNTGYQRLTGRVGVRSNLTDFLEVGGDVNFARAESHGSNKGLGNNVNLSSHRDIAYMTPTLDYVDQATGQLINVNVVNPDGSYGYALSNGTNGWEGNTSLMGNIYASQMEQRRTDAYNRLSASAYADLRFFKGLNYHITGAYTFTGTDNDKPTGGRRRFNYINGALTEVAYDGTNTYDFSLGLRQEYVTTLEHYLTYKLETDHHSLSVMFGNSLSKTKGSTVNASGVDLPASTIRDTNLSRDPTKATGSGRFTKEVNMLSYYGRLVYSLNEQLILTGTIRRDGSSNFSPSHRWGTFPSAAVAWRVKDTFMENVDAISNLKLRAGWGQTGNAGNIAGKYVYALSATNVWYNFYQGAGLGNGTATSGTYAPLVDINLKWETNEQLNFGLDLGFLDGDLDICVDYFVRNTKNLLNDLEIRPSSGDTKIYTNHGAMENKGVEFSVSYKKYLGNDFSLNATLTGSSISNKIKDLPNLPIYKTASGGNYDDVAMGTIDGIAGDGSNTFQVDGGSHWNNHSISQIGSAVGSFYGWRVDYIIRNESDLEKAKALGQSEARIGDYSFKDINGDGKVTDDDREIIGDGIPKFNYGLNLGLNYKNWDFSVYAYGVLGQKILSYSAMRLSTITNSDDNTTPAILKSSYNAIDTDWTKNSGRDYNGSLPALMITDQQYSQRVSDAWVKNGDYIKIANVQLGYTFNEATLKALHLQSARVYFAVQNLATISSYTQYGDPEVGQGSNLFTGLDTGRYPMARTFMIGANFAF